MSESLQIDNFLVIKNAFVEVTKINVLIGRQSSGKSLIAKLVYFFRGVSTSFIYGISLQSSKRALDNSILEDFQRRFTRYAWEGNDFKITYKNGDIQIIISSQVMSSKKTKLSVTYSDNLSKLFNANKCVYAEKVQGDQESPRGGAIDQIQALHESVIDPLKKSKEYGHFFASSAFVPASRSFFVNLQKSIFTFMASNLDIDPFLKEFGSLYEWSKSRYHNESSDNSLVSRRKPEDLANALDRSIETIIDGHYEYHDEQDWIRSKDDRRVNLVNASSGQQEAFPMLLTLAVWPFYRGDEGSLIFIEEPEAHLFPTSQSRIISMLTALYARLNIGFFITTHSPYVLSALNNNIFAGDVKRAEKITDAEFQEIAGDGFPINFEDVSAYTISNGVAEKITDIDFRMIGAELLDEVSDHFQDVMSILLERNGGNG